MSQSTATYAAVGEPIERSAQGEGCPFGLDHLLLSEVAPIRQ
jgi:hypothetical protein